MFIPGCDKEDDDNDQNEPGIFVARYNDTVWRPNSFSATYYRNLQVLQIQAAGNTKVFRAAFHVNPVQAVKTYALEPLGTDVALFSGPFPNYFYSDINLSDAGGSFILEKIDTSIGTISGKFSFKAYNPGRTSSLVFLTDTLQNIPLKIKDTSFFTTVQPVPKAAIKATMKGAKTTEWTMVDYFFRPRCNPSAPVTKYEILLCSAMGDGPVGKHIRFDISNQVTPGTYPIMQPWYPYTECNGPVNGKLFLHEPDACYFPISGQINIITIDTAARKLKATFSMVVRDTSSRKETIEITNGEFELNGYR